MTLTGCRRLWALQATDAGKAGANLTGWAYLTRSCLKTSHNDRFPVGEGGLTFIRGINVAAVIGFRFFQQKPRHLLMHSLFITGR